MAARFPFIRLKSNSDQHPFVWSEKSRSDISCSCPHLRWRLFAEGCFLAYAAAGRGICNLLVLLYLIRSLSTRERRDAAPYEKTLLNFERNRGAAAGISGFGGGYRDAYRYPCRSCEH